MNGTDEERQGHVLLWNMTPFSPQINSLYPTRMRGTPTFQFIQGSHRDCHFVCFPARLSDLGDEPIDGIWRG